MTSEELVGAEKIIMVMHSHCDKVGAVAGEGLSVRRTGTKWWTRCKPYVGGPLSAQNETPD